MVLIVSEGFEPPLDELKVIRRVGDIVETAIFIFLDAFAVAYCRWMLKINHAGVLVPRVWILFERFCSGNYLKWAIFRHKPNHT